MLNTLTIELPSGEATELVKQFLINLRFPVKIWESATKEVSTVTNSYEMLKKRYKNLPIDWPENEPTDNDLSGIWKGRNITVEQIREKAWKRN